MHALQKSRKLCFYSAGLAQLLAPDRLFRSRLDRLLDTLDASEVDYVFDRVNFYNKVSSWFDVDNHATRVSDFKYEKRGAYYLDTKRVVRYFDPDLRFSYLFGDITEVPESPKIVKSRPISGGNANSVLLKLNKIRHFNFVSDDQQFTDKRDRIVWRGKCFKASREAIVKRLHDRPGHDIGQVDESKKHQPDYRPFLSIREQLRNKFVLSLEGKDVATNLKWIMSSNSLCFMPKPRFETWFMEGQLMPSKHYVPLKEDCSDIEEKMDYYSANTDEALEIIKNANRHVEQFKNKRRERLISLLVLRKYFERSGQI
ncbi:Glycosyl transferase family 90 [Modicisalibacter muralis]|uniref:Glycosyl transferase family 90 n=1 Tax=Modicisalibacter muralis TaxID=119000 RepID=A0A1G9KXN9_9GAMM|nr:glycosyl transferase family 90 [Halomonas muralis]SDL54630.1 Glycosyl transferase family 90 [Halomonas muralis]